MQICSSSSAISNPFQSNVTKIKVTRKMAENHEVARRKGAGLRAVCKSAGKLCPRKYSTIYCARKAHNYIILIKKRATTSKLAWEPLVLWCLFEAVKIIHFCMRFQGFCMRCRYSVGVDIKQLRWLTQRLSKWLRISLCR